MEILRIDQLEKSQETPFRSPGNWKKIVVSEQMIQFALGGGLGEKENHFCVCENAEGDVSFFVLIGVEAVALLGGFESRREWFDENLRTHKVGRKFEGVFWTGLTNKESSSQRRHGSSF